MEPTEKKKIIIDTDPGIDDAMAIFVAFNSPEVEVIGLTTIYGNVYTTLATRNALHLLEAAERTDIPVAEGSHVTITKGTKLRIADFVHGADGLGNQNFPPPKGKPIDLSASSFLVEQANLYPGKVTVVALGPLTNISLAIELDPTFSKKIGQIVLLGGAFSVNGNVNPAAEANIFGDPDAADIVFTSGADILAVGINVTHQVVLTDAHRNQLAHSRGKFTQYLCKILGIYYSYHNDAYATNGVYLHDPTALLAAVNPSLLTYTEGIVRVQTSGITRGLTLFDNTKKRYEEITEWTGKPTVKVAVTVDAPKYDAYGVETWARGSRYRGQYRQGLRHGFGVYRFYTGDVYAGEWSNGQSHGCGVHTCEDGSRYAGEFKWGVKHGLGHYHFRNGDTYAGEYFADKMHGFGVYRFANGHRYEGAWHEGRRQGLGMYTFRNGETQSGHWQNGVLDVLSTQNTLPGSPIAVNHSRVLNAVQEARRAAEKAFDVPRVDERVNKAVTAANKAAVAARVAAVKAVQKRLPNNGDDVPIPIV